MSNEEVREKSNGQRVAAHAATAAGESPSGHQVRDLRVGLVGVGDRGSYHLDTLLGFDHVTISAICDVDAAYLERARRWVGESGQGEPAVYSRGPDDYVRMCEREDVDLLVVSTPWDTHAPICVAAMENGKHVATEVPAALTVEECWQLVEVAEGSGRHCVMLEQANYRREVLQVLAMARSGLFGELLFASGGYVHDLRHVKFDPHLEPWRLQASVDRNGNLYPTHPVGPIAWWMDINRGDRFERLISLSSRSGMLNDYARQHFGSRHPFAGIEMKQGDVNTTLLRTVDGKVVLLYFDTNTPHPQTNELRLQGTEGHYAANIESVYIEGRSPTEHAWELLSEYRDAFEHPVWRSLDPGRYRTARGHGGGLTTSIMWERLIRSLVTETPPDQNVYDAATWSAISALSERSVAAHGVPVDFPDFTRGAWKTTQPLAIE